MPPKAVFDGSKWDNQFHTTKDALEERPPTEYVIEDVLPRASFNIFYGAPGSYKTNLVMDMCICSTFGSKWLQGDGFNGFASRKSCILWIDADCGIGLLHERFGAVLRGHGKNKIHQLSAQLNYSSFLDPPFAANDDAAVSEVIKRAKLLEASIIVFDNLGNISGGMDENSSQMIAVVARLRFIAEKTQAAVIAIHHVAKNSDVERKSSRGHGSIDASADNAFYIQAEDNIVTIKQTKARRHRLPEFGALFEYEQKGQSKDLKMMKFTGVEPALPPYYTKAQQIISTYFKKNKTANQITLIKLLGDNKISLHRARTVIHTFTRCNLLRIKSGLAHNQMLYEIGDANAKVSLLS